MNISKSNHYIILIFNLMIHYTKACQTGEIESGLCGCCADCSTCCYTLFCFPCADAKAWAKSRGESCSCCHCLIFPSSIWTRANIRHARGMDKGFCGDLMCGVCCPCCFVIQSLREIDLIESQAQST